MVVFQQGENTEQMQKTTEEQKTNSEAIAKAQEAIVQAEQDFAKTQELEKTAKAVQDVGVEAKMGNLANEVMYEHTNAIQTAENPVNKKEETPKEEKKPEKSNSPQTKPNDKPEEKKNPTEQPKKGLLDGMGDIVKNVGDKVGNPLTNSWQKNLTLAGIGLAAYSVLSTIFTPKKRSLRNLAKGTALGGLGIRLRNTLGGQAKEDAKEAVKDVDAGNKTFDSLPVKEKETYLAHGKNAEELQKYISLFPGETELEKPKDKNGKEIQTLKPGVIHSLISKEYADTGIGEFLSNKGIQNLGNLQLSQSWNEFAGKYASMIPFLDNVAIFFGYKNTEARFAGPNSKEQIQSVFRQYHESFRYYSLMEHGHMTKILTDPKTTIQKTVDGVSSDISLPKNPKEAETLLMEMKQAPDMYQINDKSFVQVQDERNSQKIVDITPMPVDDIKKNNPSMIETVKTINEQREEDHKQIEAKNGEMVLNEIADGCEDQVAEAMFSSATKNSALFNFLANTHEQYNQKSFVENMKKEAGFSDMMKKLKTEITQTKAKKPLDEKKAKEIVDGYRRMQKEIGTMTPHIETQTDENGDILYAIRMGVGLTIGNMVTGLQTGFQGIVSGKDIVGGIFSVVAGSSIPLLVGAAGANAVGAKGVAQKMRSLGYKTLTGQVYIDTVNTLVKKTGNVGPKQWIYNNLLPGSASRIAYLGNSRKSLTEDMIKKGIRKASVDGVSLAKIASMYKWGQGTDNINAGDLIKACGFQDDKINTILSRICFDEVGNGKVASHGDLLWKKIHRETVKIEINLGSNTVTMPEKLAENLGKMEDAMTEATKSYDIKTEAGKAEIKKINNIYRNLLVHTPVSKFDTIPNILNKVDIMTHLTTLDPKTLSQATKALAKNPAISLDDLKKGAEVLNLSPDQIKLKESIKIKIDEINKQTVNSGELSQEFKSARENLEMIGNPKNLKQFTGDGLTGLKGMIDADIDIGKKGILFAALSDVNSDLSKALKSIDGDSVKSIEKALNAIDPKIIEKMGTNTIDCLASLKKVLNVLF